VKKAALASGVGAERSDAARVSTALLASEAGALGPTPDSVGSVAPSPAAPGPLLE